jgi:hypothetical protein
VLDIRVRARVTLPAKVTIGLDVPVHRTAMRIDQVRNLPHHRSFAAIRMIRRTLRISVAIVTNAGMIVEMM